MNIVFFTNTYLPHVGGVAQSVSSVAERLRQHGHRVLVIAPEFPGMPAHEQHVVRIPAIENFNASDFSVVLPFPKGLNDLLREYQPDVIHSHHPFLLGTTAIRLSRQLSLPLVFTHHTLYEQYTHYVVQDNPRIKTFISEIATGYANLTDQVIAPSLSVKQLIQERGVTVPVEVIPTGIDTRRFSPRNAKRFRQQFGLSDRAFVAGHLGRLAPEKNIGFLARAACHFLKTHDDAVFLVVGDGPSLIDIQTIFHNEKLEDRLILTGTLEGDELVNALSVMDVFLFASKSETQGMVINEAMAVGVPVVSINASGVGDLVENGVNGRMIERESIEAFSDAIHWLYSMPVAERELLSENTRESVEPYSLDHTTARLVQLYQSLRTSRKPGVGVDFPVGLEPLMARLKTEWEIIKKISLAGDEALSRKGAS